MKKGFLKNQKRLRWLKMTDFTKEDIEQLKNLLALNAKLTGASVEQIQQATGWSAGKISAITGGGKSKK